MITTMSIKVNAARPNMPLSPWFSFAGSPTSIRILDIPKQISSWNITSVKVIAKYPDNRNVEREAIRNGCVWVVTIEGCDISGKVTSGYEIVADGLDERGQEVSGYVLGCGDIYIMDRDVSIQKNIEKYNVRYCDELPINPAKGDLIYHNGYVRLFNGSEWLTLGSSDVYTKEETDNAISSALSAKEDAKYIESGDGKRRIYGNGDVYNLSSSPGTYGPWTDEYGGTRTDIQVKLVDPNVPTYVWGNSTLSFFSVAFNSLEEAETATEFVEAIPNRGAHWTRTHTPGTEEWVKEDELSLKSDFDLIATTYATKDELPTKTSQLENDSGFIKDGDIPTKTSQLENDSGFINDGDIPTKTSQLVNDSDFATNASVDEKIGGVTSSIPTKVSQLENDSDFANKNFVNSSIATNTANFKGTFNNESEFPTEATNNDYLFWNTVDENGNTIYKRYKYVASTSTWTYEYTLNNSSFTAEQWATINGGPYASTTDIPTKVSQLENDSNFATKTELNTVNQSLTTTVSEMQNELDTKATNASVDEKIGGVTSSIPTKVSQIENDSGYTTQAYVDSQIGQVLTREVF